jgi:hypothetical protein
MSGVTVIHPSPTAAPARRRFLVWAGTVLAVGLVVAGCGSGGSSKPQPIAPLRPSKPAAATPAPSVNPTGPTPESAIAAYRRFVDISNQMVRTGDTKAYEAASLPTCSCRRIVQYIKEVYANGGVKDAQKSLLNVVVKEQTTKGILLDTTWSASAGSEVDKTEKVLRPIPAVAPQRTYVAMSWATDKWEVANMVSLEK